jgi:membrane protease YdiL (CAAX protease family)
LIETPRRRLVLLGVPTVEAPVLTYPRVTLLVAATALAVNQVVLAAAGHVFAASCVDAVVLVLLLNAAVVYEHPASGRDLVVSRAFGALALVAAVPVAAAALPLRHVSEATGTIIVAIPVAVACLHFASRNGIELRLRLFSRTDAGVRTAAIVAAIAFGFCAYILKAPTVSTHGVGPVVLGVTALTLAAISEELLFRGVVQASLAQVFGAAGVVFAAILSGALFTTLGWWLIPVLGASLSFALVVAITGALGPAIIAHVAFVLSAAVVWPSLLDHWRPALPLSVVLGAILCGGSVAIAAAILSEERWSV